MRHRVPANVDHTRRLLHEYRNQRVGGTEGSYPLRSLIRRHASSCETPNDGSSISARRRAASSPIQSGSGIGLVESPRSSQSISTMRSFSEGGSERSSSASIVILFSRISDMRKVATRFGRHLFSSFVFAAGGSSTVIVGVASANCKNEPARAAAAGGSGQAVYDSPHQHAFGGRSPPYSIFSFSKSESLTQPARIFSPAM